ncbi:MAG: hypothetical protein EBR82_48025 [Caulobacteraceae bacterium]|nr:hypothetical protein [Caulobacteraceae bacterium]
MVVLKFYSYLIQIFFQQYHQVLLKFQVQLVKDLLVVLDYKFELLLGNHPLILLIADQLIHIEYMERKQLL